MLAILSPAKRIQPCPCPPGVPLTEPVFRREAGRLGELLRGYAPWQLESLLGVSPQLGLDAFALSRDFDPDVPGSPALLAYQGLAYWNLDPGSFSREDLLAAQERLRILSTLYGVLRPLDGISPHRLDFLAKIRPDGKTLYRWWGDRLRRELFSAGEPVVNLCSQEYAKAVSPWLLPGDVFITVRFLQQRGGRLVTRPTAAKAARGQMARWLVLRRVREPEELVAFDWEDYRFSPELSGPFLYTFLQE
jgi:cytoplasmic iron level regulating protein YaaA (DUF328/UPF0246 family)